VSGFAREQAELALYTAILNFAEDITDEESIASPEDAAYVAAAFMRGLMSAGWREPVATDG
jgi:hypothetical protein